MADIPSSGSDDFQHVPPCPSLQPCIAGTPQHFVYISHELPFMTFTNLFDHQLFINPTSCKQDAGCLSFYC